MKGLDERFNEDATEFIANSLLLIKYTSKELDKLKARLVELLQDTFEEGQDQGRQEGEESGYDEGFEAGQDQFAETNS